MNFAAIRDAIKVAVTDASGLTAMGAVEWADSAVASYARAMPRVDLRQRQVLAYGDDEERQATVLGQTVNYLSGNRRVIVSVRVEADAASSGDAWDVAEKIRTRLGRRSIAAALLAVGLNVADSSDIQTVPYKRDGRELVVCALDLFVNCASNDADDTLGAGDHIATTEIASEYLTHPDGAQSPQIALTVEDAP